MSDVARLAGVGTKTVSRVLNGEPNVSPTMTARVNRAVQSLNYQINVYAGSLRRSEGRTRTFGLLVGSVDNPFAGQLQRAVEDALAAQGIAVFAASLDEDPERERSIVREFLRRRVDGLILTTVSKNQSYLFSEVERGTPIVFVDRAPNGIDVDAVISSNAEGAAAATRHLIGAGHRRIAYLGDHMDIQTARERNRGFVQELSKAGIPSGDVLQIEGIRNEHEARGVMHQILDLAQPPTAIFAAQNLVTLGAIRALRERDLHKRIALVGFDDIMLGDLLDPGITVVAQNPQRIGALAAERALARMQGKDLPTETLIVPTTLIPRGSGEIPPHVI